MKTSERLRRVSFSTACFLAASNVFAQNGNLNGDGIRVPDAGSTLLMGAIALVACLLLKRRFAKAAA